MAATTGPKSVLRATVGVLSIAIALLVIPIGFVLLVVDSRAGQAISELIRPLAALTAGGGLLAFGIAMLIWEMSVRYGIRR